jgi:hypothetical protein
MTDFTILDQSGADLDALKKQQFKNAIQFEREKTALKYYMAGKGYVKGIKALGFVEQVEFQVPLEERFRKDKATPSLHHQVRIAMSVTQLKGLTDLQEERAIICALLHDVQEDRGVDRDEIMRNFGVRNSDITWKLTKKFAGRHKNKDEYIRDISQDLIAALVKGLDRNDNLAHMIDVFSVDKIEQYTGEAETVFLPMLKNASKLFPELFQAYQSISLQMKQHIKFMKAYVKVSRAKANAEADITELQTALFAASIKSKALTESNHTLEQLNKGIDQRNEDLYELFCKKDEELKLVVEEYNHLKSKPRVDGKKVFAKVAGLLVTKMRKEETLTYAELVSFLDELSVTLQLSTLELNEFTSDDISALERQVKTY